MAMVICPSRTAASTAARAHRLARWAISLPIFASIVACSDANGSTANMGVENLTAENLVVENLPANFDSSAPAEAAPSHRYSFSDGDLYGYLGAVSPDQAKAGIATPSVVMFRYDGYWDGEQHLDLVLDNGAVSYRAECDVPCVAIKETFADGSMSRVGYTPDSVIGSAFLDAMNGQLRRSPAPGAIKDGYRFEGGDPMNPGNWVPIQPSPQSVASAPSDDSAATADNITAENLVVANSN